MLPRHVRALLELVLDEWARPGCRWLPLLSGETVVREEQTP